jgi:hypothetical protein
LNFVIFEVSKVILLYTVDSIPPIVEKSSLRLINTTQTTENTLLWGWIFGYHELYGDALMQTCGTILHEKNTEIGSRSTTKSRKIFHRE